jgi:hypothetical protein
MLDERGWKTPPRESRRPNGGGDRPFSRGHLYRMLGNAIYRGQIMHKGTIYPGEHPAIIDGELWDTTQRQLAANRNGERSPTATAPSLLAGLAFDDAGNRLGPSHAKKGSRRYRYYVSATMDKPLRVPAQELENIVARELAACMADELSLHALCDDDAMLYRGILAGAKRLREALLSAQTSVRNEAARSLVQRIVVGQQAIRITVLGDALGARGRTLDRHASITLKRCGQAVRLISASATDWPRGPDPKLIALLSRAQVWFERLATGKATALEVIAKDEQVTGSWVARVIHLAFLAPDIAQAIVDGRQPPDLTAERLMRIVPLPIAWEAQREHLGF